MEDEIILYTVKKMLGITADYPPFDLDIVTNINMAFFTLHQLGLGPKEGFSITVDSMNTWSDFIGHDRNLEAVKTYVYLRVRMAFDPPASSFVYDAMKAQADELEWRLREQVEIDAFSN